LAVDLLGVEPDETRFMRLTAYVDSRAKVDFVPQKWVQQLELHGEIAKKLENPISVEWLDKKSVCVVKESMELLVRIADCDKQSHITYLGYGSCRPRRDHPHGPGIA
jgi:hypothetical protein